MPRTVKHLVGRQRDLSDADGLELETHTWEMLRNSEDRIEGRKVFQENRPPLYRGK